jgi:hypothetical protein
LLLFNLDNFIVYDILFGYGTGNRSDDSRRIKRIEFRFGSAFFGMKPTGEKSEFAKFIGRERTPDSKISSEK